jgi:hypothetical protein
MKNESSLVPSYEGEAFAWHALSLPGVVLDARELAELDRVAGGAARTLSLDLDEKAAQGLADAREVALLDAFGRLRGTLRIEVVRRDLAHRGEESSRAPVTLHGPVRVLVLTERAA